MKGKKRKRKLHLNLNMNYKKNQLFNDNMNESHIIDFGSFRTHYYSFCKYASEGTKGPFENFRNQN